MDITEFSAEYVAENFKEECGNIMIEICKRENGLFDLGFYDKYLKKTLFEEPINIKLTNSTLEQLIEFKQAITTLIERIEIELKKNNEEE